MASVAILDKTRVKLHSIDTKDFAKTTVSDLKKTILVNQTLPFRIKLTNIGIPSYTPGAGAPIGIAIIGFNNYIL